MSEETNYGIYPAVVLHTTSQSGNYGQNRAKHKASNKYANEPMVKSYMTHGRNQEFVPIDICR